MGVVKFSFEYYDGDARKLVPRVLSAHPLLSSAKRGGEDPGYEVGMLIISPCWYRLGWCVKKYCVGVWRPLLRVK